jgi:hypothetical protein
MTPALVALVLAQAMPLGSPAASAAPPAPAAAPAAAATLPGVSPEDAVIRNSGSTNAAGYAIVVHRDGSVEVVRAGVVSRATLERPQTAWLFAKLQADDPISNLVSAHCMRSMSFGSTTRVTYRGATTGDLGCTFDPAARELKRTVDVIAAQLGVSMLPRRPLGRMRLQNVPSSGASPPRS